MLIEYSASVFTPAGWRNVTITADAERISAGMGRVVSVRAIDGSAPVGTLSRTGARRQEYHASGVASREVGARKRLSACRIIEE
jgi:hypothetical protein